MKNKFISKVFAWLCIGLLITFGIGYAVTLNEELTYLLLSNWGIISIIEVISCIVLTIFINKMSNTTAKLLYLLHCALTGVTFTAVFLAFELTSILWVILATAIIFGVFAAIGSKLKIDLSGFGTFLLIALLGILVLTLLNIFLLDSALNMTISFVSIFIFSGYIAYDMNRIIKLSHFELDDKYAVFWAFELYLDIINIILDLLNLTGNSRD